MSIHPDIQDQAYQFFIEEAPELLDILETGILSLQNDRSTAKIHNLMRAAHSLKGSSASVGLAVIKDIAHRLESIFKALYHDSVVIDTDMETLLLQAYDALNNPLRQQISTGGFDKEHAIAQSDSTFSILEELLSEELERADDYLPSSSDMGIDMVASIFEVDVEQGIERLESACTYADPQIIVSEVEAQAEVFEGIAELLNLQGFGSIAKTTRQALQHSPEQVLQITQLCLNDFRASRAEVMAGKRTGEGAPCEALIELAGGQSFLSDAADAADDVTKQCVTHDQEETLQDPVMDELDMLNLALNQDIEGVDGLDALDQLNDLSNISPNDLAVNDLSNISPNDLAGLDDDNMAEADFLSDLSDDDFAAAIETAIQSRSVTESEPTPPDPSLSGNNDAIADAIAADASDLNFDLFPSELGMPATDESTAPESPVPPNSSARQPCCPAKDAPPPPPHPRWAIDETEPKPEATAKLAAPPPPPPRPPRWAIEPEDHSAPSPQLDISPNDADSNVDIDTSALDIENIFDKDLLSTLDDEEQNTPPPALPAPSREDQPKTQPAPNPATLSAIAAPNTSIEELKQHFHEFPKADEQSLPPIPAQKSKQAKRSNTANEEPDGLSAVPLPKVPPPPKRQTKQTQSKRENNSAQRSQDDSSSTDIAQPAQSLSVRVSLGRLERMDNQVGELAINRNGLSLQQEQLQRAARDLTHRFSRFQGLVEELRESSDKLLINPSRQNMNKRLGKAAESSLFGIGSTFDSLEMDQYSALHSQLQGLLEEVAQIEESVEDVVLFTGQSNRTLQDQRQMLKQLRHELMWARMLPLGEVLNRFPRVLRDLSAKNHKPVDLKLVGTSVLIDRAVLEKLYDPLLHLLRNAFDHGIESAERRKQLGKPAQGTIEIRAYHLGNKTMIEIRDDGSGLNLANIKQQAVEKGLISANEIASMPPSQIFEIIFEPGLSTAKQVSDISGRGVGLDIVRSRLRALQGTVTVTSEPERGTTFTLCLPLTLTIAKLLVCSVGATAIALPSDSIEEIVVPKGNQVRQSGQHRFLSWRDYIVPIHPLSSLLDYNCTVQQTSLSRALAAAPMPREWALPLLVLQREQHFVALEINRLVTEQELVIKPFSKAIASPGYAYGCTILGDGTLLPVLDGYVLIDQLLGKNAVSAEATQFTPDFSKPIDLVISQSTPPPASSSKFKTLKTPQVLVVDDAATLRRTLALTLQRAGYQVIQARDGREAIERLESQSVHLVICDIEMPNMNGFEFLNYRRQHQDLTTIPVAMLTSRSNDKHRQLAMHLGANAYFTKPYTEQEFISSIQNILSESDKPMAIENSTPSLATT